jgi:hypothetical protein
MEGIIWMIISILGTRRVFRLVIPPKMTHPSFERYVLSWIAIAIWWLISFYFVIFLSSLLS